MAQALGIYDVSGTSRLLAHSQEDSRRLVDEIYVLKTRNIGSQCFIVRDEPQIDTEVPSLPPAQFSIPSRQELHSVSC
jgi:hypothetical protein